MTRTPPPADEPRADRDAPPASTRRTKTDGDSPRSTNPGRTTPRPPRQSRSGPAAAAAPPRQAAPSNQKVPKAKQAPPARKAPPVETAAAEAPIDEPIYDRAPTDDGPDDKTLSTAIGERFREARETRRRKQDERNVRRREQARLRQQQAAEARALEEARVAEAAMYGPAPEPVYAPVSGPIEAMPVAIGPRGRLRHTIRRVDLWSVVKIALCFYVCMIAIFVVALIALYVIADGLGIISDLEDFIGDLIASDDFELLSFEIMRGVVLIGLVFVAMSVTMTVIGAALYNLFAELFGGIEVVVSEEELPSPR